MPPSDDDQHTTTVANLRRRGRLVAATLAVVLGLGGASMVGYAVGHQQVAPQPSSAVADLQGPEPGKTTPWPSAALPRATALPPALSRTPVLPVPLATPSKTAALPAAAPTFIHIPAINISSRVNNVGLNPDHTMEVPPPGPLYDQPAWYRYSPTPGEIGPSVIIGHVDSARGGPSVFFTLGALKPGQRIEVARTDNIRAAFVVDSVESFPKDSFPIRAVYGYTDYPALRLITCGGSFDKTTGNYRDNIVVFAHLVEPVPA